MFISNVRMCIVSGRFSWLSKKLFALKEPPDSPLPPSDLIDYTAHLSEVFTFEMMDELANK